MKLNVPITLLVLLLQGNMPAANSEPAADRESSPDKSGPTPSSLSLTGLFARAIVFYYPWYGNPETDRRYANWDHFVQ